MKKLYLFVLLLSVTLLLFVAWNLWQNNRDIDPVSQAEIKQRFDNSVSWLVTNYTEVENIPNPILWWMIKQAAFNSNDESLNKIFATYKKERLDRQVPNLSTPMFDKFYRPQLPDITQLSSLQDYQTFFFYSLSCDDDLGSETIIQKQMSPGFLFYALSPSPLHNTPVDGVTFHAALSARI